MRNRKRYPKEWRALATKCKEHANWKCIKCGVEHGLDAPVLVDGHHIGKLGQCYAESRDGELVARLRTSVTRTE